MLELKLLCTATVEVEAPLSLGNTPSGIRSVGGFRSATISGEGINATLAGPAAADWITINGRVGQIDVRMTVKTDDGALIQINYAGKLLLANPGGPVAIVAPTFATGDERYAWLNDIQAFGRGVLSPGSDGGSILTYEIYQAV